VSEDALCLKGIMDAPVSWEYVMLLDEDDLNDFFAILQEPTLAHYIHSSENRWRLYLGLVKGGVQIAVLATVAMLKHIFKGASQEERLVIELPPPAAARPKKKKKKPLYVRKLKTTMLEAPTMTPGIPSAASPGVFWPGKA